MSDNLSWNYSSEKTGTLFYPMNGTGDLSTEGYGQLLPIAAADYNGVDSVTVMPASSFNAANCEDSGEVSTTLSEGLAYDEKKANRIESYLEGTEIEANAVPSREIMGQEDFWSYLADGLESSSRSEIRERSPLPDWRARKSADSSSFIDAAAEIFPVADRVKEEAEQYQAADLYLPMQAAEASVARDLGMDAKLGIWCEKPFDEFTYEETGFPAFRTVAPLDLSGNEIVPYAGRSNPEEQVLIEDSSQEVTRKVSGAEDAAAEQVEEIARQLDDDIMEEKLP